jgi:hypothetical protein
VISRRVVFAIVQGVGTITREDDDDDDDDASLCRKTASGAIDWWWPFGLAVSSILLALLRFFERSSLSLVTSTSASTSNLGA